MRLAGQFVAFRFFVADGQQPDARLLNVVHDAREHAAHDRELQQVRRTAFDARADVEQQRRPCARRYHGSQGRPIDALQHAECAVRRHHRRARMTRADERRCLAVRDGVSRDFDRGFRLSPECRRRRLLHPDDIRRVDDANA